MPQVGGYQLRTTLTLIGDRVANAGDFLALGEGNHKSPGWLHLCVDWDPQDFYKSAYIRLADEAGSFFKNLNAVQILAVEKFCRQYVNFYKDDLNVQP